MIPHTSTSHTSFLMPIPRAQWRTPSRAMPKDQFGNENQTRFRLTGRLNDGFVIWRGWFEDRDDADAFLFALADGSLKRQRALWDLPTPAWAPGMHEGLTYDFATVTFLNSTAGSFYTVPGDWNSANNTVEGIGAGGNGGVATSGPNAKGGGGGAYARVANLSIFGLVSYRTGTPGGTTGSGSSFTANTYLSSSGVLVAAGGATASTTVPGASGTVTNSVGAAQRYAGGAGGTSGTFSGGGGGAAGINGAGYAGASVTGVGGSADAGTGAIGASPPGSAGNGNTGGAGTEWDVSHGSGGGASSGFNSGNTNGGVGGNYGAGGGGATGTGTGGLGATGLIVVTYIPAGLVNGGNMPMMGM